LRPEPQLEALKRLVLRNPDHTPTAIMFLIALRESGRLIHNLSATDDSSLKNIPHRILQYWDDAEPPPEILELMNSWQIAHPDFQYIRLHDETAEHFLQEHNLLAELKAYRRAREPAQRADLLRLAYLGVHGGFYIDADDRCLAPVTSYLPADATFVAFQEDFGTLANNFLGVIPNHPVIKHALQLGTEAINRGDHDFLWLATGPGLLTRVFAQFKCRPPKDLPDLGEPTILDMAHTARHIGIHCPVTYKKTERHWSRTNFGNRRTRPLAGAELSPREYLVAAK
jgi:mannosyltransferase OCH1-like enzyme